ncbi:MAG: hypothetical protein GXO58_07925 [Thermodesulfobacteria bacterium]|nr:hypothetical protein [Thermodesulfobacteriota bacterium]
MRCKKCGWISFDWLENCGKCGKSLKEERLLIGTFIPDREPINWFELKTQLSPASIQDVPPIVDTEVPELTQDDILPAADLELEGVQLEEIAENEDFQKALEELAG